MNLGKLALESESESSEDLNYSRRETGKFHEIGNFSTHAVNFSERSLMLRNRLLSHLSKAEGNLTMGCRKIRNRLERMKD